MIAGQERNTSPCFLSEAMLLRVVPRLRCSAIIIFRSNTKCHQCLSDGSPWLWQILDADFGKRLESSTGRIATRDIVQFVPVQEVQGQHLHLLLPHKIAQYSWPETSPSYFHSWQQFYQQVGRSPSSNLCSRSCLGSSWSTCAPGTSSRSLPSKPRRPLMLLLLLPSCEAARPLQAGLRVRATS
jgi:hypothetical protein